MKRRIVTDRDLKFHGVNPEEYDEVILSWDRTDVLHYFRDTLIYGEWGEEMPKDIPESLVQEIVDYFERVDYRQSVIDKVVEEFDLKAEEYVRKNKDKIITAHKTEKLKKSLEKTMKEREEKSK